MFAGYSLAEARKAAVALVVALAAGAAFVIHFDPSLTDAIVVLTGEVFAVIGVFATTNHSADDVAKAVTALQGAALSVVGYFATVSPGTGEKITALATALVGTYAVFQLRNDPTP